jgi:hypothetical protein
VIDHGTLNHVNNENVHQLPDGSLHMLFCFQAVVNGQDRITYAYSPDGLTWNGSPEPYTFFWPLRFSSVPFVVGSLHFPV